MRKIIPVWIKTTSGHAFITRLPNTYRNNPEFKKRKAVLLKHLTTEDFQKMLVNKETILMVSEDRCYHVPYFASTMFIESSQGWNYSYGRDGRIYYPYIVEVHSGEVIT